MGNYFMGNPSRLNENFQSFMKEASKEASKEEQSQTKRSITRNMVWQPKPTDPSLLNVSALLGDSPVKGTPRSKRETSRMKILREVNKVKESLQLTKEESQQSKYSVLSNLVPKLELALSNQKMIEEDDRC
mmetsp:Transcript_26411/g.40319  ORF Transcript_26411/g.40319 Transcript_26411/m.40319 type:complete len:131 (+) Transcript_26411:1085-1477(+)